MRMCVGVHHNDKMDLHIALPAHSLANLVHASYSDMDGDPEACARSLLAPYYITSEQVEALMEDPHWPGRPHPSHPLYAVVKEARKQSAPAERRCLDAVNKERFIMMATSVSHAWLVTKPTRLGGGFKRICTYQGINAPVPHAWLHMDRQGMLTLCATSRGMPVLHIIVHRSCAIGYMRPLELEFGSSSSSSSHLNIYADVDSGTIDVDHESNSGSLQINYALLFTRSAPTCQLSRAVLLSPSLQRTWTLPIVLHTMPDVDVEEVVTSFACIPQSAHSKKV